MTRASLEGVVGAEYADLSHGKRSMPADVAQRMEHISGERCRCGRSAVALRSVAGGSHEAVCETCRGGRRRLTLAAAQARQAKVEASR